MELRFTLGGRRWKRRVVPNLGDNYGHCDYDERTIRIKGGLIERDEFDTDVHELLHALFPWMNEDEVTTAANDMTTVLFDKLCYRRGRHGAATSG